MQAKVRHLWGFSATWWKVMPMHNAWGEREDFVWLLFIDHQSSSTAHTRLSQPPHLMRCNLSQIKKAGAEEKQESSKLPTLSRIKKKKETTRRNRNVDVLFSDGRLFWCTKQKRSKGKREQRGWCLSQRWALTKCFIHVILHALSRLCSHRSSTSVKVSLGLVVKKYLSHKGGAGDVKLFAGKLSCYFWLQTLQTPFSALKSVELFSSYPSNPYLTKLVD